MSDTIVAVVLVVSTCLAGISIVGLVVIAHKLVTAMNEANERNANRAASLTAMFADGCMAISGDHKDLMMRRLDAPAPTPAVRSYIPDPVDTFDATAIIEAGPPPHGGDPNR